MEKASVEVSLDGRIWRDAYDLPEAAIRQYPCEREVLRDGGRVTAIRLRRAVLDCGCLWVGVGWALCRAHTDADGSAPGV